MNQYKMEIIRLQENDVQTLGKLDVYMMLSDEVKSNPVLSLKTLELAWKHNRPFKSCIATGIYKVKKRRSLKHGQHFILENRYGRTKILIHKGNFYTDITGCILVGTGFTDINLDSQLDVTDSKKAMKALLKIMSKEFELTVMNDIQESDPEQIGI